MQIPFLRISGAVLLCQFLVERTLSQSIVSKASLCLLDMMFDQVLIML